MRKTMAFGGSVALLAAGVLSGQAVAAAKAGAGIGFRDVQNWTVRPGGSPANLVPRILTSSGPNDPEGTFVYALSAKPLTGGAWSGKLPAGMTAEPGRGCTPKAGVPGVFLCDYRDWNARAPRVRTAVGAADGATVHFGVVLVPKGASVDRGVRQAQTAAARPEDRRHAARTVTVKTAEHAARNIVDLHAPGLKAGGGWVRQSVKMNVVDATKLEISFAPAKGQRPWDGIEPGVEIGSLSVTGPAKCFPNPMVTSFAPSIVCDVRRPDKVTVSYRLKARADTEAWKIRSAAVLRVWNEDPRNPQSVARFAVDSPRPVRDRHDLMARGKDGRLWSHSGTGDAALALDPQVMDPVGKGFGQYDRLLKLSPITGQNAGAGVLGRDRSGVLWFHPMGRYEGLAPRTRVSAGWNEYDELIGASDVTGDRTPDLLARDPEGNLYVYAGRPGPTWRIGNRTTLDGGWERYDRIVGASDVTGDGNPDLVARDRAGVLWLRAGTGDLTDPFRARTRVGAGWGVYRSLSGPGDLTDDGRADLVAQDAAGDVWLYRGTGKASAPFAPPVKALLGSDNGGEVKGYDALL
ncbi:FG-GAP repeat domain-containing protein [Streptomyces sp. 12297]